MAAMEEGAATQEGAAMQEDYQLLDAGEGERLERWGPWRLRRPDPRAGGPRLEPIAEWDAADAHFQGEAGRGRWLRRTPLPEAWTIRHGGVRLIVRLAPFKHTGVFPEQAEHWHWMTRVAGASGRSLDILNLFAYTGGATVSLAKAGHRLTHVDASKPALAWARENAAANDLPRDTIRWIHDDAAAFARRERRRGRRYHAVLMDPPAVGHTPRGATWRVEDELAGLVRDTAALLDDPVFFLVNHYARDADVESLATLMRTAGAGVGQPPLGARMRLEQGSLRLRTHAGRILDTGAWVRLGVAPAGPMTG